MFQNICILGFEFKFWEELGEDSVMILASTLKRQFYHQPQFDIPELLNKKLLT